jgi:biopolymer transport protein ExbD
VDKNMISVEAKMQDGKQVVLLEDKPIDVSRLVNELRAYVKASRKTELLLQYDNDVTQDLVVKIIDGAKGAGLDRVRLVIPD